MRRFFTLIAVGYLAIVGAQTHVITDGLASMLVIVVLLMMLGTRRVLRVIAFILTILAAIAAA